MVSIMRVFGFIFLTTVVNFFNTVKSTIAHELSALKEFQELFIENLSFK